jgi:hypothetical protein
MMGLLVAFFALQRHGSKLGGVAGFWIKNALGKERLSMASWSRTEA